MAGKGWIEYGQCRERCPAGRKFGDGCLNFLNWTSSLGNLGNRPRISRYLGLGALSSGTPGKRLSKLISGAGATLARVVVKPIQRPRKITVIHITRERAAAALPAKGADESLSQR